MNLTVKDAQTKWCPLARTAIVAQQSSIVSVGSANRELGDSASDDGLPKCIATECMGWKWSREPELERFTQLQPPECDEDINRFPIVRDLARALGLRAAPRATSRWGDAPEERAALSARNEWIEDLDRAVKRADNRAKVEAFVRHNVTPPDASWHCAAISVGAEDDAFEGYAFLSIRWERAVDHEATGCCGYANRSL